MSFIPTKVPNVNAASRTHELFSDQSFLQICNLLTTEEQDLLQELQTVTQPQIQNPTELKEGVVCLFYDLLIQKHVSHLELESLSEMLGKPKQDLQNLILIKTLDFKTMYQEILKYLKSPTPIDYKKLNRYGSQFSAIVLKYIKWIFYTDLGAINPKLLKSFNNSISSAAKIYDTFMKFHKASFTDMGDVYDQIRTNAVAMVNELTGEKLQADKWCPADLFIYKDKEVRGEIVKFQDSDNYNSGDNSFLSYFDTNDPKILGISLKESEARQGTATSFVKVLNQNKNYPTRQTLIDPDDKQLSKLINAVRLAKKDLSKNNNEKTQYWSRSGRSIFKSFPEKYKIKGRRRSYTKKDFSGEFNPHLFKRFSSDLSLKTKEFTKKYANMLQKTKTKFFEQSLKKLDIDFITKGSFSEKSESRDFKSYKHKDVVAGKMDPYTVVNKLGCYETANFIFQNFEEVGIKKAFKNLTKTQNPLAALTAYAVGMAGFSPTFFKFVGSDTGLNAHFDVVYGSGILEYGKEKNKLVIADSINSNQISLQFLVDAFESSQKKGKLVKRYQTRITIRNIGDKVTIEVDEFSLKD